MTIWISIMVVECLFRVVVELHYVVNFGIWVDKDPNTNVRLVKMLISNRYIIYRIFSRRTKLLVVK